MYDAMLGGIEKLVVTGGILRELGHQEDLLEELGLEVDPEGGS